MKCKSAVRALTMIDSETLLVGQNEGWLELVRVKDFKVICSANFNSVGHVFVL